MAKNLLLALGLHGALVGGPKAKEVGEDVYHEVAAAIGERVEQHRIQAARERVVERAREEMRQGRLNLWEFLRDSDAIELLAAGERDHQLETVEQRHAEAVRIFRERLGGLEEVRSREDMERVMQALQAAFDGYHYYGGFGEGDVIRFFEDEGGPCVMNSLGVLSVIGATPLRRQIGINVYPPNEEGIGHWAPALTFETTNHRREQADLVAGRPAMPTSAHLTPEQIVEDYALQHNLADVGTRVRRLFRSDSTSGRSVASRREEQEGPRSGWNISEAEFRRTDHPYPSNLVPLYGRLMARGGYDQQPIRPDAAPSGREMHPRPRHSLGEIMYNYQSLVGDVQITGGELEQGGRVPFVARGALSEAGWEALSEVIDDCEEQLRFADTPVLKYRSHLGLAMVYRMVERAASLALRRQIYELSRQRADRHAREALALLTPAMQRELAHGRPDQPIERYGMLSYLGPRGREIAFQQFLLDLQRPTGVHRSEFIDLALNPEMRPQVFAQIETLPADRQIELAGLLAGMEDLRFDGSDLISREVRGIKRNREQGDQVMRPADLGEYEQTLRELPGLERDCETNMRAEGITDPEMIAYAQYYEIGHVLRIIVQLASIRRMPVSETSRRLMAEQAARLEASIIASHPYVRESIDELQNFLRVTVGHTGVEEQFDERGLRMRTYNPRQTPGSR